MLRLVFDLAGVTSSQRQAVAGTPLALPVAGATGPIGIEVRRPSGDAVRVKTEPLGDSGQVLRYADTFEIGVYAMRSLEPDRPLEAAFSVNADPEESDPARIDAETLESRLDPTPMVLVGDPAELVHTLARLREGTSLWGFFLWAVLGMLVFETFLSNRLGPKGPSGCAARFSGRAGNTGTEARSASEECALAFSTTWRQHFGGK